MRRRTIYDAIISERDGQPPECTIFPLTVPDTDSRLSAWITARGDAYVHLDSMV